MAEAAVNCPRRGISARRTRRRGRHIRAGGTVFAAALAAAIAVATALG